MTTHRLVYTSKRKDNCDDFEIQKILAACKQNNTKIAITGILVHSDQKFIQVLEGEKSRIEGLYEKISKDDRHDNVRLRSLKPIQKRTFGEWHMAYKDLDSKELDFNTYISQRDQKQYKEMLDGKGEEIYTDAGMNVLKQFLTLN